MSLPSDLAVSDGGLIDLYVQKISTIGTGVCMVVGKYRRPNRPCRFFLTLNGQALQPEALVDISKSRLTVH